MVDLGNNKISDTGIRSLVTFLNGNMALRQLKFDGNKGITDKSIPLLLDIINNTKIEDISVEGTDTNEQISLIVPLVANVLKNEVATLNLNEKFVDLAYDMTIFSFIEQIVNQIEEKQSWLYRRVTDDIMADICKEIKKAETSMLKTIE